MWILWATPRTQPVTFRLLTPGARLLVMRTPDAWSIAPDEGSEPVSCEVSGEDSAVALFVMGRLDAGHPGIAVTDETVARDVRRYFPGP